MTDDLGPGPRKEATQRETAQALRAPSFVDDAITVGGCRLHERLGQGGMGTVYAATQLALGRRVAVKVVTATDPGEARVARFKREARVAASLEHPHCIPIYAAGEEDGLLYLVMRLVRGPDLGALLAAEGPLAPDRALALIEPVAGALDAAHASGLVHRDVKPANILVEPRPAGEHAYLSDFGLMRHVAGDTAITRVGEWVGSVEYVAPEQIEGREVDGRADVYALAGVLFTALTGRSPFSRATPAATALAHRHDAVPKLGPGAEALSAVIARGMAKAPYDRFASAGDLMRAARAAVSDAALVPVPVPVPVPVHPPASATNRHDTPTTPTPDARRRARRGLMAGVAALGLGAAVAVAAIALLGGSTRAPSRATSSGATTSTRSPLSAQRFTGNGFTFAYPAGFSVVEDQRGLGTYIRTKAVSADGGEVLIVDRTPGDTMTPRGRAIDVSNATERRTHDYVLVGLAPATVAGRSAFTWAFTIPSAPLPASFDVFQRLGTSGYAVLVQGTDARSIADVALAVAGSLEGS